MGFVDVNNLLGQTSTLGLEAVMELLASKCKIPLAPGSSTNLPEEGRSPLLGPMTRDSLIWRVVYSEVMLVVK